MHLLNKWEVKEEAVIVDWSLLFEDWASLSYSEEIAVSLGGKQFK